MKTKQTHHTKMGNTRGREEDEEEIVKRGKIIVL